MPLAAQPLAASAGRLASRSGRRQPTCAAICRQILRQFLKFLQFFCRRYEIRDRRYEIREIICRDQFLTCEIICRDLRNQFRQFLRHRDLRNHQR